MAKLRPCEYCGHVPTIAMMRWPRGTERIWWTVKCTYCGASGPTLTMIEDAEEAWQKRAYQYSDLTSWDNLPDVKKVEKDG